MRGGPPWTRMTQPVVSARGRYDGRPWQRSPLAARTGEGRRGPAKAAGRRICHSGRKPLADRELLAASNTGPYRALGGSAAGSDPPPPPPPAISSGVLCGTVRYGTDLDGTGRYCAVRRPSKAASQLSVAAAGTDSYKNSGALLATTRRLGSSGRMTSAGGCGRRVRRRFCSAPQPSYGTTC